MPPSLPRLEPKALPASGRATDHSATPAQLVRPPVPWTPAEALRPAQVLLVAPASPLRHQVQVALQELGHRVHATAELDSLARAPMHGQELVVLQLGEGGAQHPSASAELWWQLRALRLQSPQLPVLVVQPGADSTDRTLTLELGADAVLDDLYPPRLLAARVTALLRRARQTPLRPHLGQAGWHLDALTRSVTPPGGPAVALSPNEYRLMRAFLNQPGRVLSRAWLLEQALSADLRQHDRSVDLLVSRLRRRLGSRPDGSTWILTERGAGYLLADPVQDTASAPCQTHNVDDTPT